MLACIVSWFKKESDVPDKLCLWWVGHIYLFECSLAKTGPKAPCHITIHLHSAASAQQTCNINFSVVFLWTSPSRAEQVLTSTVAVPMVIDTVPDDFYSLVSELWITYIQYTPLTVTRVCMCMRAVNSLICMCARTHTATHFCPYFTLSNIASVVQCVTNLCRGHKLC